MQRRKIMQLMAGTAAAIWVKPALSWTQAPDLMPLFPLDLVLLPHTILPLHIFEPRYKEMIQDCLQNKWEFGMLSIQDQALKRIGCTASITEVLERFSDGRLNILVRGGRRFQITSLDEEKSYYRGRAEFIEDDTAEPPAEEDVRLRALELYNRLSDLAEWTTRALQASAPVASDPQLSYRIAAGVPAEPAWMQNLLELRSERERLDLVMRYFEELIENLENAPGGPSGPSRRVARLR
jgi:Lon protease-like protein